MRWFLTFFLVFACIFAFCFPASAQAAEMFSTVTADDWSYIAVKDLIQDGLIAGDQARFTNGTPITRFELAILVANGRQSSAKASVEQKALLDKLFQEYNLELMTIGAIPRTGPSLGSSNTPSPNLTPDPVRGPRSNPLNVMVEGRFQFGHTSLEKNGGGAWHAPGIADKSQFMQRYRIYFNGAINEDWAWNARYYQSAGNINNAESPAKFDRFFVAGKAANGTVMMGKLPVAVGIGGLVSWTGDANGAVYFRNFNKLSLKLGDAREYFAPLIENKKLAQYNMNMTAQDLFLAELTYKPTRNSSIGVFHYRNNYNDSIHDSDLYGVSGIVPLNAKDPEGLTFSFEAVKNHADDKGQLKFKDQSAYIVYLFSKNSAATRPPWISEIVFKNMPVDPLKKGDHGWVLSYRHMPSGATGFGNRNSGAVIAMNTDTLGTLENAVDDINAFRLDYQFVPRKNVQWNFVYDRIKPINGNWTNNSIQTSLVFYYH